MVERRHIVVYTCTNKKNKIFHHVFLLSVLRSSLFHLLRSFVDSFVRSVVRFSVQTMNSFRQQTAWQRSTHNQLNFGPIQSICLCVPFRVRAFVHQPRCGCIGACPHWFPFRKWNCAHVCRRSRRLRCQCTDWGINVHFVCNTVILCNWECEWEWKTETTVGKCVRCDFSTSQIYVIYLSHAFLVHSIHLYPYRWA